MLRSFMLAATMLTACAGLMGCTQTEPQTAPAPAMIVDADVVIQDGYFDVSWTASAPVNVYRSSLPNASLEGAERVSEADEDGHYQHPRQPGEGRTYFLLEEQSGAISVVASRLLPLEGGRNFRDLGGYKTETGQTIAWGRLFRSGVMHELTANDYGFLRDLNIAVICDLRSTEERHEEPTDWQAGAVDMVAWDYVLDQSGFMAAFAEGEMSAERSTQVMSHFYGEMAYTHAPYFEVMFDRLAAGDLPLAFHCSAGKDRTGLAAALILSALGVDRDTIIHDYALSDDYVDYMAEMANSDEEIGPDHPMYVWTQLPREVIAPFMGSIPVFLESAFARIEADHGDVRTYLRDELNVTDEEIAQIRAALLQ